MNKRKVTYEDLGMPPERQKELRYFCRQYKYWKLKLETTKPSVKSQNIDGMPFSNTNNISDTTQNLAIKRVELQEKIKMIEDSAKEASPYFWKYIINSVCYECNYDNLQLNQGMPLSEAAFRDRVKMFFRILDQKRN